MARLAATLLAVVTREAWSRLPEGSYSRPGECAASHSPTEQFFPREHRASIESQSTVARLFSIAYGDHFKVVTSTIAKEQYVLTQCGTMQPTLQEINDVFALPSGFKQKHFSIPLRSAVATSTAQLPFLEQLGVQDRVKHVAQYASGACWQKALGCGASLESSWGGDATRRAEQLAGVDAVFLDCASTTPMDCSNVHSQSNGVHLPATQESDPLASAEYIKFVAAFFNKEPQANSRYQATQSSYKSISVTGTPKVVAWLGLGFDEASFVLSQATYKLTMVSDAQGANVDGSAVRGAVSQMQESDAVPGNAAAGKTYTLKFSDFNTSGACSATCTSEDLRRMASSALFPALNDVDAVIDETYAVDPGSYTFTTFLQTMALSSSSDLKFIRNKLVFRLDGTLSEAKGLDWFESRIARPELAVVGLARVLHGDATKPARYFRNIATDEVPDFIKASSCSETLPVCSSEVQAPSIIELLSSIPVSATPRNFPAWAVGFVAMSVAIALA